MNPKSAQQKGKRLENYVCEAIKEMGLGKAVRTPGSGSGKIKGDTFSAIDFTIECKNQKQFHWQDIEQAKEEAQQGNYYKDKWALIIRDPRKPEFESVYAIIDLGQFLELLKKNSESIIKKPDRETAYLLKSLKEIIRRVLNKLE